MEYEQVIKSAFDASADKQVFLNEVKAYLHTLSLNENPVDLVRWVPIELVQANDYNPNSVANMELKLLYASIAHDGYTQPIVTIYDSQIKKYVIVDGFHRYYIMKTNKELFDKNHGLLPVVVLDKPINDRMASTIRHNRARGKHNITGMSAVIFKMLDNGWKDDEVCNELGMEPEELLRLKHITGFSKLFENTEYRKAWETRNQVAIHRKMRDKNGN